MLSADKVGAIYASAENPGEITTFFEYRQACPLPLSLSLSFKWDIREPAPGETMGIIKYSAWMVCRARPKRPRSRTDERKRKRECARCHLHINCPPKIILAFNFPLPDRLATCPTSRGTACRV